MLLPRHRGPVSLQIRRSAFSRKLPSKTCCITFTIAYKCFGKKKLPLADVFGQYGVVGYELAVLVERADCVVQVDYEVLCAELSE